MTRQAYGGVMSARRRKDMVRAAAMEQRPSRQSPTALIVEDDAAVAKLLDIVFAHHGFSTMSAGNGKDAIAKIKSDDPDLIVLDLLMPMMNGFEVIREVAAFDPDKVKRIIVLTSASESTLKNFSDDRIHSVLRKPFDVSQLLSAARQCLAQR